MSALLVLPALWALALAEPTAAPLTTTNADRVFVFAFKGDGVDDRLLGIAERAIVQVADDAGLETVSQQDLAAMLDIEASRQANGCEGDTACLAEIAGGLGARRVVTGTLTRLDDGSIDVDLTLLDKGGSAVAARASGTAKKPADIKAATLQAGRQLFGVEVEATPATSLRPVLLGVGGVTTVVGLAGLVGLWPLVTAMGHHEDAVDAAADFERSGSASDFDKLAQAHTDYTSEAAAWNTWGVAAVVVGGVVATAGVVVTVMGAVAE